MTDDPAAVEEWERVTALLASEGMTSELDRAAISLYATAYSRWQHATQQLAAAGGPLLLNERDETIQNPWLAIVNQAARALTTAAESLGLTPASRSKLKRPPCLAANPIEARKR